MKKNVSHISDKMTKTKALYGSRPLRRHIPKTLRMTRASLLAMLRKERMVYVKPCRGLMGRGVVKVETCVRRKGGVHTEYAIHAGVRRRRFASYGQAYRAIRKLTGGKPYLVQKGIRLMTYRGRVFDLRVMVQRKPRDGWEVTGIAGRVAHPRKAVTNGSQGGTIYPVEVLLQTRMESGKRRALTAEIRRLGLKAARQMGRVYPAVREIGADIALDRRLKPWILEVNTRPDPCPFAKLPDRGMLRRIVRVARTYGRTYRLRCVKSKRGMKRGGR